MVIAAVPQAPEPVQAREREQAREPVQAPVPVRPEPVRAQVPELPQREPEQGRGRSEQARAVLQPV